MKQWEKAISCFNNALKRFPEDCAAQAHLRQCQILMKTELPDEWDGAINLDEK